MQKCSVTLMKGWQAVLMQTSFVCKPAALTAAELTQFALNKCCCLPLSMPLDE